MQSLGTFLENPDCRIPAVDRAISLFELLENAHQGLTFSELRQRLSMPKSTTHYLIQTLATRGYLQRSIDGRHYLLSLQFGDVVSSNIAELNLRTRVSPYLSEISKRFKLTATTAVLRNTSAVIVDRVLFRQDLEGGCWIGRHVELHCTAQGKALISRLSDANLDQIFHEREPARFTPKTITTLAALRAHLKSVRATGYAVNDEEQVLGIRAVAVNMIHPSDDGVVCISVRGTKQQISRTRLPVLGEALRVFVDQISQGLH
jgi:DNA-binding IclR family transcriptional regulator